MSGEQDVLDPRLGASNFAPSSQYPDVSPRPPLAPPPQPQPPISFGGAPPRADNLKDHHSPQPYYYPSPQTHTPQQSGGYSAGHSNQASPAAPYTVTGGDDGVGGTEGDDGEGDGENAEDAKRPRACEACRGLKVRCDQDPAHPEIPCKRCAKAGRQCIITQPNRKRQKKENTRVAELERKLDALTAALHQSQAGAAQRQSAPSAQSPAAPAPAPAAPSSTLPAKRRRIDDETPTYDGADQAQPHHLTRADSGNRGGDDALLGNPNADLTRYLSYSSPEQFANRINSLINPELAASIFLRYTTELAPHLPAVVFTPGTTAQQVFQEKPILYVCILTAASHGTLHPDVSKQIAKEAIGAIADCVVRNGAKSLELIQAMQVTALWYKPPERAEQTNFYQIIHMSAVMALDIGLGKRFNPSKARRGFGGPNAQYAPGPHRIMPTDSDTIEARRAWLCCYYLCASASMVLRRPNLVRWTNYMKECIEVLESHPDAFPSDKLFCQHIKIQHICEEIGLQFLMDDNTANISITDPKVSYALNILENDLKAWKEQIPPDYRNAPGLRFFEHVTSLYLHEIALHFNHNVDDFRLPFTEESLKSVANSSETLTQHQMAALEACLKAAHGILDTMLSFDVQVVKTLPMLIYFVRCIYASVVLIKMHVAVCAPNSELGKMMKPDDLKVDYYMDSMIAMFSSLNKGDEHRPHPKILRILNVLRDWFVKHKENALAPRNGTRPTEKQTQLPESKEAVQQSPLDLLSQVATGNRGVSQGAPATGETADWNFSAAVDYQHRHPSLNAPKSAYPHNHQTPPQSVYPDTYPIPSTTDMQGIFDPNNPEFGWGTNFEYAMDMALGPMDGLQGFLGDSMGSFGFNGEMIGPTGQW